jgi:hypothetical protein
MFHTLHKIIFKTPQTLNQKNVSFLPFRVIMNTQTHQYYTKTPIPNNNKLPCTLSSSPSHVHDL